MNFDLNSALFGLGLGLVCTMGLFSGVYILFQMMEAQARDPEHYSRNERIIRYLIAATLLIGQMAVAVFLLYRFSDLLANPASWGVGLAAGIFGFSLAILPLVNRKKS